MALLHGKYGTGKLVTRWIAEFFGYAAGVLPDGGSVANFKELAVARKIMTPFDISGGPLQRSAYDHLCFQ